MTDKELIKRRCLEALPDTAATPQRTCSVITNHATSKNGPLNRRSSSKTVQNFSDITEILPENLGVQNC